MNRMSPIEFKQWLEARTKKFAVNVFKLLDSLPKKNSLMIISNQLGRSASSVGANYREANRAESADDFGHKIQIALKEASETVYWFEVLSEFVPVKNNQSSRGEQDISISSLLNESIELRNLLQSISRSQRSRRIKQSNN